MLDLSMKMNKEASISKSTSDNLIDLYTRIPDYSDVQHLGQSDFINTLEKLKEEFRQCRASLYNEEFCSDSEYLAERSSPVSNTRSKTTDNLYCYSSNKYNNTERKYSSAVGERGLALTFSDGNGKATKINNHNLTATLIDTGAGGERDKSPGEDETGNRRYGGQFLSIKSCELHRIPYRSTSASSLVQPGRYLTAYGRSSGVDNIVTRKNETSLQNEYDDDDDDDEDEDYDNNHELYNREWSVVSSNSDVSISKWSSTPEISRSRSREYLPPSNVQQRLLQRKSRNNSAPSVAFKEDAGNEPQQTFKANPVPNHVYKPLYEFIMLKNQRRSERIREQSKRRLLAQVKPFSFCKESNKSGTQQHGRVERGGESLNNTKPPKKRRNDTLGNVKTNNNRLNSSNNTALFKAKPAPPRTKALLAAIRQKEQQEYRELKKRLRAEILLKNASLPPSMAARERRTRLTNAKIDEVLSDYQKAFRANKGKNRNLRETSTGTDETGLLTDDDRMTEDDFSGRASAKKITTIAKPFKFSQRTPRKFTSFGTSRHSAAAVGVFEASSNDNHASKLRYEAAKKKEERRVQLEEEEMLKIIKAERRRQKLRDCHLHAWQHACSYSAEQDIAMRRQLRHAASILERETFIRDMSCMLSRVRSAPLLLEGGHRLERKQEPCKKHREEFTKLHPSNSDGADRPWNKLSTPRLYNWSAGRNRTISLMDRFDGEEKSETLALAEGSLSSSDNESSEHDDDDNDNRRIRPTDSFHSGSDNSDFEQDIPNENKSRIKVDEIKGEMLIKGGNRGRGVRQASDENSHYADNEINDEAGEDDDDDANDDEHDDDAEEEEQNGGGATNGEVIEGGQPEPEPEQSSK